MPKNGAAVTYVMGERWCWSGIGTSCLSVTGYNILWAKEFRYDEAQARYASIDLDATLLKQSGIISPTTQRWTHYDGDQPSADATMRDLELGIARVEPPAISGGANTMYYHTDHLGTTRLMSDASGYAATGWHSIVGVTDVLPSVYTAFGENIAGPLDGESNRYGYVGDYGYQAHTQSQMSFLHIGYRYYNPASGRFLQRDPVGIAGGLGTYGYVDGTVTGFIDLNGLARIRIGDPVGPYPNHPSGRVSIPYGGSRTAPPIPWWKPSFPITTPVVLACVGVAAGVATVTTVVNHVPSFVNARKRRITDYVVDWVFGKVVGQCPGC